MKYFAVLVVALMIAVPGSGDAAEPGVSDAAGSVLEVNAFEAYEMLMADPATTYLIDCRSMAEYELLGHPPMAHNIPYQLWSASGYAANPDFVDDVARTFKKTDTLLVICRSGKRSREATRLLADAGFERVVNVVGGFEGPRIEDEADSRHGLRGFMDGWVFYGLPRTYELHEPLKYKLHASCGCE